MESDVVLELARGLRERVLPFLGSHAGREVSGAGHGGDVTFAVDEMAESWLEEFVAERAPRLAFYSEDRGLVAPPDAADVLVVDPIDGTRPAMAGLESACVAVAMAPLGDGEPTMADLEVGCVVEIKSGDWFMAMRGSGVRSSRSVAPSTNTDVRRMFWSYGFRGRPARTACLQRHYDGMSDRCRRRAVQLDPERRRRVEIGRLDPGVAGRLS